MLILYHEKVLLALKKVVNWIILKTESISHTFIRDVSVDHIGTQFDLGILLHGFPPVFICNFNCIRKRSVGQRQCRGLGYSAGHVGNTIVDHAVHRIDRIGMRGSVLFPQPDAGM